MSPFGRVGGGGAGDWRRHLSLLAPRANKDIAATNRNPPTSLWHSVPQLVWRITPALGPPKWPQKPPPAFLWPQVAPPQSGLAAMSAACYRPALRPITLRRHRCRSGGGPPLVAPDGGRRFLPTALRRQEGRRRTVTYGDGDTLRVSAAAARRPPLRRR